MALWLLFKQSWRIDRWLCDSCSSSRGEEKSVAPPVRAALGPSTVPEQALGRYSRRMSADALLEQFRPALTGHCYRMLGSVVDAEDAVQEAMLRAWKGLENFREQSALKTWLYRIATNVCLDTLAATERQRLRPLEISETPGIVRDDLVLTKRGREHWVEPIPDAMALPAAADADPEERALLRESIRLAFVAALQYLPPRQRALLLLTIATVGVAVISEILVGAIEPMTEALHWNPAFVGLVFLPLIGGLPEYFNTISMALDKRMGMVLAASAGSSIQIALLMAPILVLVSLLMPARLDLVFSIVELAVLALATFLFSEITSDGELVWLEGLLLILLYAMMGCTVFLFGSGTV